MDITKHIKLIPDTTYEKSNLNNVLKENNI